MSDQELEALWKQLGDVPCDDSHLLSRKHDSLRLTQQPLTHDTVIRDTWLRWTRLAG